MKNTPYIYALILATFSLVFLTACESLGLKGEAKYPKTQGRQVVYTGEEESIFGEGGLDLFGSSKKEEGGAGTAGIGVNSYLWQASLDTLSFMPIASADPFGGTILTDWYSPAGVETERFKVNVFLSGRRLESSALRVSMFKQERQGNEWQDVAVARETIIEMEDAILSKARDLRIRSTGRP